MSSDSFDYIIIGAGSAGCVIAYNILNRGRGSVLLLEAGGPAQVLAKAGIAQKAELPVGRNFHDHLHMSVNATINKPISLFGQDKGLNALRHGIEWTFMRSGC